MTDGVELNGGQSEITEVPSSESENELVESPTERYLAARRLAAFRREIQQSMETFFRVREWHTPSSESENELVESPTERYLAVLRRAILQSRETFFPVREWYTPSSESENELVESPTERYLAAWRRSERYLAVWFRSERYLAAPRLAARRLAAWRRAIQQSRETFFPVREWPTPSSGYGETQLPFETLFSDFDRLPKDKKLSKQKSKGTWSDQSLALLITVMSLFAGAAYMVLFSFHDAFPLSTEFKGVVNLSIMELLTFPKTAIDDFLVIATVTTTFMLSMGMNTIAVCIFFRKFIRGTFLTILSLFTIVVFSVSFFAMLSKFFPHHITIAGGNLKIPATAIVIFYDIYVIILVCAFAYTVHWWRTWWRSSRRKQDAVTERVSIV